MDAEFDHDRLDAYRLSREAVRAVRSVVLAVPRGHGDLLDQLRRASLSVCLNTAEGAGAWLPKEKARFYRIARGSATECAAVLDHLVDLKIVATKDIAAARSAYARVVATLTRLSQTMDTTTRPLPVNGPGPVPVNPPRKR